MKELAGKTAVITGGASGIGLSMAHRFGAAGMRLVVADIEQPALDDAVSALRAAGYETVGTEADVRDLEQVKQLQQTAADAFGATHVLCNNAGVGSGGPIAGLDDIERFRWTIDVNLWGVVYGCKVFLPAMIELGEPCHVVNTASMAGLGSAPFMGAYNVSKYGVVALSETMYKELDMMDTQVGVSVLCPAFVNTGIADSDRNMPAELQADEAPAETTIADMLKAAVAGGLDPAVIADAVHDAVVDHRFWILTHPEAIPGVTERAEQIVNGTNPVLPPGFMS